MPSEYHFPFTLAQLAAFREVATRLHFRQAAAALSIAQPALSRQVRALEDTLGHPLLARTNRRVALTPAGEAALGRVEEALRLLARLGQEVRTAAEGGTGLLRIRFTGLAMATVLPPLIREFSRSHPRVRIELTEAPTSTQWTALAAGEFDLGFLHPEDRSPAGCTARLLLAEKNGVVLPADHPLASRRRLTLAQVADLPFVLFPRAHNPAYYDRTLAAFAAVGRTPRIAEEVWPRSHAWGLVLAGLGATLACPSEAAHLPGGLAFHTLSGPAPESRVAAAWRSTPLTPVLRAFLAVLDSRTPAQR